jgi:predicted HAD superfamily Cof-like phosphohydrolase
MSNNMFNDVIEFHDVTEQLIADKTEFPSADIREMRIKLLAEEMDEYLVAEKENDIIGVADALADMTYIICGTAVSYGIPLDIVFNEVHKSNMTKIENGNILRREDGKIMKPPSYKPPDIRGIIKRYNKSKKKFVIKNEEL